MLLKLLKDFNCFLFLALKQTNVHHVFALNVNFPARLKVVKTGKNRHALLAQLDATWNASRVHSRCNIHSIAWIFILVNKEFKINFNANSPQIS